jgi:RHS repeat-associated protein
VFQTVAGATGQTVFRDVYVSGTLHLEWRWYAQQNVNGDVVALVGGLASATTPPTDPPNAGNVLERYAYAPYGGLTVLTPSGVERPGGTLYSWRTFFQGGRLDAATGLYLFGLRDYDPSAGVWMQRDPIGQSAGDPNLYRFVGNNPVNFVDPTGLAGEPWYNDNWRDWFDYTAWEASWQAYYAELGERMGEGYGAAATLDPERDARMDQLARERAQAAYNSDPLGVDLTGRLRGIAAARIRSDLSAAGKIVDGAAAGVEMGASIVSDASFMSGAAKGIGGLAKGAAGGLGGRLRPRRGPVGSPTRPAPPGSPGICPAPSKDALERAASANNTRSPALPNSPYNPNAVADRIRPSYRANPAHNPRSPLFNPRKTPEPSDAAAVYQNAVRGDMKTWYGRGSDGSIYRYFYDNAGGVHFSGTVQPNDVTNIVRQQLGL